MSSKCERVFDRASYNIILRRGNLNSNIVNKKEILHS